MSTVNESKGKKSKQDLGAEEIKSNAQELFGQKQDAKSILLVDAIGNI